MEQDELYKAYLKAKGQGQAASAVVPEFNSWQDLTLQDERAGVQNFAANLRVCSNKGLSTAYNA